MQAVDRSVSVLPSDTRLSRLVAGVWRMGEWRQDVAERLRWIEGCLELGISSFDHADVYGGDALAAAPGLRSRLQIVTKCGTRLVSPQRPAHAIKSHQSFRRCRCARCRKALSTAVSTSGCGR